MTKTILIIAIAATLILGTFALGNTASAVISENPALQSKIITEKSPATCTTEEGVSCEGEARTKFYLSVTEVDENGIITGVADGKIKLGIKVTNPGDVSLTNIVLVNLDSLSFKFDLENKMLSMSGYFTDNKNKPYEFNAIGAVEKFDKKAAPINLTIHIVGENGIQIESTSAGVFIFVGMVESIA